MADRYWVGGTGNWSDDDNHWSTSSGGSPANGNLPTSSDDVHIDSSSGFGGGGTITIDAVGNGDCNNFTANSGHNFTINDSASNFRIYGSITLEAGLTIVGTPGIALYSTTSSKTLTINGATITTLNLYGVGGGWALQDNLILSGEFYQENGTFDANGYNVTASSISLYADTGYTPIIRTGSGLWTPRRDVWQIEELSGEKVTILPKNEVIRRRPMLI